MERVDVVVIGAGAAGLMAGIQCGRGAPGARILVLDGAERIGAKILISGGGRCNVTNERVDERDFSGSSPAAIRRVLARFGVDDAIRFFEGLGLSLKREDSGKLFPVANRARAVLGALLEASVHAGAEVRPGHRIEDVEHRDDRARSDGYAFLVRGPWGSLEARHVVLATGGRSVPATGSDGHGYVIARTLGHTTTRLLPALVPLTLPDGHLFRSLRGVSQEARLSVLDGRGRPTREVRGSVLLTHFGLSGPGVLDVSRHLLDLRALDGTASLRVAWLPDESLESTDAWLRTLRGRLLPHLGERLKRRLASALLALAGLGDDVTADHLPRAARRRLAEVLADLEVPVKGPRGWNHAEVTAGGVPLAETNLGTLASRRCPNLHLCGEILDVDGRIGGFNFQWAWASGHVVGEAIAREMRVQAGG